MCFTQKISRLHGQLISGGVAISMHTIRRIAGLKISENRKLLDPFKKEKYQTSDLLCAHPLYQCR